MLLGEKEKLVIRDPTGDMDKLLKALRTTVHGNL